MSSPHIALSHGSFPQPQKSTASKGSECCDGVDRWSGLSIRLNFVEGNKCGMDDGASCQENVRHVPVRHILDDRIKSHGGSPSMVKLREVAFSCLVEIGWNLGDDSSCLDVAFTYLDEQEDEVAFTSDEEFVDALVYSTVLDDSRGGNDGDQYILRVIATFSSQRTDNSDGGATGKVDESSEETLKNTLALYHASTCESVLCSSPRDEDKSPSCGTFVALSGHLLEESKCKHNMLSQLELKKTDTENSYQDSRPSCKICKPVLRWLREQRVALLDARRNRVPLVDASLTASFEDTEEPKKYSRGDDENLDPNFVHARHQCDVCGRCPIVGYRYHAVPIEPTSSSFPPSSTTMATPFLWLGGGRGKDDDSTCFANFDLCQSCHHRCAENKTFTPNHGIKFVRAQYAPDRDFPRHRRRGPCLLLRRVLQRGDLFLRFPLLFHDGVLGRNDDSTTVDLVNNESVNEGIRKSLDDLKKRRISLNDVDCSQEEDQGEECTLSKRKTESLDLGPAGSKEKARGVAGVIDGERMNRDGHWIEENEAQNAEKDEEVLPIDLSTAGSRSVISGVSVSSQSPSVAKAHPSTEDEDEISESFHSCEKLTVDETRHDEVGEMIPPGKIIGAESDSNTVDVPAEVKGEVVVGGTSGKLFQEEEEKRGQNEVLPGGVVEMISGRVSVSDEADSLNRGESVPDDKGGDMSSCPAAEGGDDESYASCFLEGMVSTGNDSAKNVEDIVKGSDSVASLSSAEVVDAEEMNGSVSSAEVVDAEEVEEMNGSVSSAEEVDAEEMNGSVSSAEVVDAEEMNGSVSSAEEVDAEEVEEMNGSVSSAEVVYAEGMNGSVHSFSSEVTGLSTSSDTVTSSRVFEDAIEADGGGSLDSSSFEDVIEREDSHEGFATEDDSDGDWDVLDEDDVLARAAHSIGSALYRDAL